MKRPPLYSARRPSAVAEPQPEPVALTRPSRLVRLQAWLHTPAALWTGILLLAALLVLNLVRPVAPGVKPLTQKQFDAAVLHTLNTQVVPSQAARAADAVGPSVVRVMGYVTDKKTGEKVEQGVGTGVCGDTTPHPKPHPAPLLEAARRMGMDPAECVYVGDDERDIQAGRAAGMPTVAALYGYLGQRNDVSAWGADAIIESPADLLKLLALP